MSELGDKPTTDDETTQAINDALKSVERLEQEAEEGEEHIDLEAIEDDAAPDSKNARDPILEAMVNAKNELTETLKQTQKEALSMKERLARVSADFDNYKKRQVREQEDAKRFANERLLKDMMPVLDNLDRALDAAKQQTSDMSDAGKNVVDGVQMVLKQFSDTLKKHGVTPFSALGEVFDPNRHEAVAQREDTSAIANTVIEEYQRGYLLHDRLVRPAMVIVATGGPEKGAEDNVASAEDAADETASEEES